MHQQLLTLFYKIIKRIMKLLVRLDHLIEEEGITYMVRTDNIDPDDVLMPLQAASSTYRIAMGPRTGRKVLSLQYAPRRAAQVTQALCANAHGFSLHAGVHCDADQRSELEQLCRYVTRPAIANERLSVNRAGQVVLKLKPVLSLSKGHLTATALPTS